jgi:hypothetical protein
LDSRRLHLVLLLVFAVVASGTVATIKPAHATLILELSDTNGSTVCPDVLSGFGAAQWNSSSSTCTLYTASPVSPTLCIRGTVGGCVVSAIDTLQIDQGVTFAINTTLGGVAIYSTLDNYGIVNVNDVGLANYGTMNNWGLINVSPNSNILNLPFTGQGIINNFNGTIVNQGIIGNEGTINNSGSISNFCPGIIEQNPILGDPVQHHPCQQPLAPIITTPSGSGFKTTTPTITGTSQPNVTITLFADTGPVGDTASDFTGNWSITTSPLTLGFQNLTAAAANSFGTSPFSPSVIILISPKQGTSTSSTCTSSVLQLDSAATCVATVYDKAGNELRKSFVGSKIGGFTIIKVADEGRHVAVFAQDIIALFTVTDPNLALWLSSTIAVAGGLIFGVLFPGRRKRHRAKGPGNSVNTELSSFPL